MIQTVRLVLKQSRFEVVVLGGTLVVLGIAIGYLAWRLASYQADVQACLDPTACRLIREEHLRFESLATPFAAAGVLLPILAGIILGVPIVAREVEQGTASLPWSISSSRLNWLFKRVAILGIVLGAVAAIPSIALDQLTGALLPNVDVSHSYQLADARGAIVEARTFAAFGIATFAGALTGRSLAGVLLAIFASAALLVGLQSLDEAWLRSDAVLLPDPPGAPTESLITSIGYALPDGRIVDWATAIQVIDDPSVAPEDVFPPRYFGVSAALAPDKRLRESGIILLAGFVCVASAAFVVDRRRPY